MADAGAPSARRPLVIVVGGSGGMGKGTALACAKAGFDVLLGARSADKLAAAAADIRAAAPEADVRTGTIDAEDEASVAAFFAALPPRSVAHLVVTVGRGVGCSSLLGADGFAGMQKQLAAKTLAQLSCVSYGESALADGGCIVLTSGALSRRPGKGSTALAIANAALEAAVKGLANDLGPRLRIACISPGLFESDMWAGMPAERRQGMLAGFGAAVPAGRAGTPADLGAAALFCLQNGWVTGTTIDVDGGAVVRA